MQQKNLIVPLVADFGGPKAIKAISKYLKDHGATLRIGSINEGARDEMKGRVSFVMWGIGWKRV
jgi:hypothetical protein